MTIPSVSSIDAEETLDVVVMSSEDSDDSNLEDREETPTEIPGVTAFAPPLPEGPYVEALEEDVRAAKERADRFASDLETLLQNKAAADLALQEREAKVRQHRQEEAIKEGRHEDAALLAHRKAVFEDLSVPQEEDPRNLFQTSLTLQAALMEGSLQPERRGNATKFHAQEYGAYRTKDGRSDQAWTVQDKIGRELVAEGKYPYVFPSLQVDLRSPECEASAVRILHSKAIAMTPRLPGCTVCGGHHPSKECTMTPPPCSYPRCTEENAHFVFMCPSLHKRCEVCFARGHSKNQDVCRELADNLALFEACADKGLATSLRRADPVWGQWAVQGPVTAAAVRAAGYYNLVHRGALAVARWLRLTTCATQAIMGLDIPPRRGLTQEVVSKAICDRASRVGWSLGEAAAGRTASSSATRYETDRRTVQPNVAGRGRGRGTVPLFRSSSSTWREVRPGLTTRAENSGPSKGRGRGRYSAPEGAYATPIPSGSTGSSRQGISHARGTGSDTSKRKSSPRSTERAARKRREATRRESSSCSTTATPARRSPASSSSREALPEQDVACLRSILARWEQREQGEVQGPPPAPRTPSPPGGASSRPSSKTDRGGEGRLGRNRGKGTKRK